MADFIQKLFTSRQNYNNGESRLGELNRIWYDSITNTFRISDGVTPGGRIIGGSNGGGGNAFVYVSAMEPLTNGQTGNLWWNTTDGNLYIYYAGNWVPATTSGTGTTIISVNAPMDPTDGLMWYSSIDGRLFVWYNNAWVDASPSIPGQKGDTGATGPAGADGAPGTNGQDGSSAYQVAVNNGFVGTEAEWLASLKGADGSPGAAGSPGLSAYQIAVNNGFVGTEAEWLASLVGAPGTNASVVESATAPLTPNTGDLWWDTTDGNLYIYYGTSWVPAVSSAGTPISGGTATVIESATSPSSPTSGMLWWNTSDSNLYIYYAGNWSPATSTSTGTGNTNLGIGSTPPSNPTQGSLWWNDSDGNLYVYYNGIWIVANQGSGAAPLILVSDTAPSTTQVGYLWWNTVDGNLYVYYSHTWMMAFSITGFQGSVIDKTTLQNIIATSTSFEDFQAKIAAL